MKIKINIYIININFFKYYIIIFAAGPAEMKNIKSFFIVFFESIVKIMKHYIYSNFQLIGRELGKNCKQIKYFMNNEIFYQYYFPSI